MRVDRVIKDLMRSLRQALMALDHNITVQDNFGPAGAEEGSIIVSRGRERVPVWADGSAFVNDNISQETIDKIVGQVPPTPIPPEVVDIIDNPPGPEVGHWEPLAFASEIVFDNEGDVVMVWHDGI